MFMENLRNIEPPYRDPSIAIENIHGTKAIRLRLMVPWPVMRNMKSNASRGVLSRVFSSMPFKIANENFTWQKKN